MKVYIMTSGPHYEGPTTTRIFEDRTRAIQEGLKIETVGHWEPRGIPDYWESKMDWMSVNEKEVEK